MRPGGKYFAGLSVKKCAEIEWRYEAMKESDYIKVENLTLLRSLLDLSRKLLGGEGWGISETDVSEINEKLYQLQDNCSKQIGDLEDPYMVRTK